MPIFYVNVFPTLFIGDVERVFGIDTVFAEPRALYADVNS